ncbi:MAG: hypothetical protein K2W97_04635 [Chthoniobacterales bacterium]|nr:hypothetical protein [Chthoniobacterales bacterium]
MEILPRPISPTEAEIKAEEQQIRCILFGMPRLFVFSLMLLVIITAVAVAYNFNVMQWLE